MHYSIMAYKGVRDDIIRHKHGETHRKWYFTILRSDHLGDHIGVISGWSPDPDPGSGPRVGTPPGSGPRVGTPPGSGPRVGTPPGSGPRVGTPRSGSAPDEDPISGRPG